MSLLLKNSSFGIFGKLIVRKKCLHLHYFARGSAYRNFVSQEERALYFNQWALVIMFMPLTAEETIFKIITSLVTYPRMHQIWDQARSFFQFNRTGNASLSYIWQCNRWSFTYSFVLSLLKNEVIQPKAIVMIFPESDGTIWMSLCTSHLHSI